MIGAVLIPGRAGAEARHARDARDDEGRRGASSTSRSTRAAASRPRTPTTHDDPVYDGRRRHPLLRREHARRGADHLDEGADERDAARTSRRSPTTGSPRPSRATRRSPAASTSLGGKLTYEAVAEAHGLDVHAARGRRCRLALGRFALRPPAEATAGARLAAARRAVRVRGLLRLALRRRDLDDDPRDRGGEADDGRRCRRRAEQAEDVVHGRRRIAAMPRACVIVLDAVGAGELAGRSRVRGRGLGHARQRRPRGRRPRPAQPRGARARQRRAARGLPAAAGRAGGRRPAARALEGQGHDDRPLGADGRRHADRVPDVPARLPARRDRPVHEPTGRGVLGNKPASGTEIIQELGEEHQQTGQVDRLHVRRLGLPDRRARGDDPARGALRRLPRRARDPHRQARGRPRDRAAVRRRARATTSGRRTATTSRSSRAARTT